MLQKEHLIYYKVGLKNLKRNKMKNKHILPKMEESKQETQEEAAKEFVLSHDFSRLTNPNHLANRCFQYGAEWNQEQILQFLYSEITERRDYSSSKMCEKVIEFIEQLKNKI